MRRVPVVTAGSGDGAAEVATAFGALLGRVREVHAGNEGFDLSPAIALGPEPSVLVDCGGGFAEAVAAVRGGHAAVTADLAPYVRDTVTFAVLRSDRRLGVSGALLPGLPLAAALLRLLDAGDPPTRVELYGTDAESLTDEAVAVAALLGVEVARERVRAASDGAAAWRALVTDRFPVVTPAGDGTRRAVVTTETTTLTLAGDVGGPGRTAAALLADVVAFAREEERPWRVHRRAVARVS